MRMTVVRRHLLGYWQSKPIERIFNHLSDYFCYVYEY